MVESLTCRSRARTRRFGLVFGAALGVLLIASADSVFSQDFAGVEIRSQPLRGGVHMLIGRGGNLAVLSGKPVWLLVGEFDQGWLEAGQATADALSAAGADVTLEVLAEQEHVLLVSPVLLMNWIDEALGR